MNTLLGVQIVAGAGARDVSTKKRTYLVTWNFRFMLISRFWCARISRHLNFAILRNFYILIHFNSHFWASSETQGQIKGARESLNGWKNIYGTKKSKEWREKPLGTMSYQTSSKRSPPFWLLIGARKLVFFWHQSEARTAATVWNWSGKTSSPGALLAVLYFSLCHIFPPV